MSFLNIKDRNLRDKMIEDYLAVKKRLKERNMNERMDDLAYRDELEDTFKPVWIVTSVSHKKSLMNLNLFLMNW